MRHSFKTGLSFGLTSSVITTLGLMVGLSSGTHDKSTVISGIIMIAIADAFSDALGIHIAEESENKHTHLEIWEATLATFFCKFTFSLTFLVPILFLRLDLAVAVSVFWGLLLLALFNYYLAREQETAPWRLIAEHLFIALIVITLTHLLGIWVSKFCAREFITKI